MRVTQLRLTNFLSHADSHLLLQGVHVAALLGENGAGKTALLDALTWGLWGQSRAAYGHDAELVRHGAEYMEVQVEVESNTRTYRVLRRKEAKGGGTLLTFQEQTPSGWVALDGNGIRETQTRIVDQLGLDYEIFVNSAYLRQGHADQLTTQTPADRKRVLSTILGLERWEDYRQRARDHQARAEAKLAGLQTRRTALAEELETRDGVENDLTRVEDEISRLSSDLERDRQNLNQLRALKATRTTLLSRQQAVEEEIAKQQSQLQTLAQTQSQAQEQASTLHALLGREEEIRKRHQELIDLRREDDDLNERHRQTIAYRNKIQTAERKIEGLRAALDRDLHGLEAQVQTLRERLNETAFQDLQKAKQQLKILKDEQQSLEDAREAWRLLRDEAKEITARNQVITETLAEVEEQENALERESCPVCQQPLDDEHREPLLAQLRKKQKELDKEATENTERYNALRDEMQILSTLNQERAARTEEVPHLEQEVARLQQVVQAHTSAESRIAVLSLQVRRLTDRLQRGNFAQEERECLTLLRERLEELSYDEEDHSRVRSRLRELDSVEGDYQDLLVASERLSNTEERLQYLENERSDLEISHATLLQEREGLADRVQDTDQYLADMPILTRRVAALEREQAAAITKRGAVQERLRGLERANQDLPRIRQEESVLAKRVGQLRKLRDAFGVNGIPAMVIEYALPELEREANRILEQLTGGRMHVRLDTQRETKAGTVRETLDIIISDEKGTRPYENFSGGEQFRINFAIRVALAHLLAQRAGVRLRSLFIDEGFGSLDGVGRQRLVEAVGAIQDDFDLILVITHIEELQDAFPTRIYVEKTASGSEVRL